MNGAATDGQQPMTWTIRLATPADGDAIVVVQTAAWQTAYAGLLPADRLAALSDAERQATSSQMWSRRSGMGVPDACVLVADVDGAVSAFAAMSASDEEHSCELNVFHVHPSQWGTGLASALMDAAIDWMKRAGYLRASLWTLRDAARARRFYEREGWAHDGRTQHTLAKPMWAGLDIPQVRYVIAT